MYHLSCFASRCQLWVDQTRDLFANCCRYLLYEVVWKDNKVDDSLSKHFALQLCIPAAASPTCNICLVLQMRLLFWQYSEILLQSILVTLGSHALPCPCQVVNTICAVVNTILLPELYQFMISCCFGDHAVKYYNPVTNLCMLRCGTEEYRQVAVYVS